MLKFQIFIFFIFCILHQWGLLNAASANRHVGKESQESSKVCQSAECKNAASEILKSIDSTANKCDDFYKFACGNFLKTAVIPEGEMSVDRYNVLQEKNKDLLKKNLEEPIQHNEPRYFTLPKNLYKACMDEAGIEKNGLHTILDQFKKMGGWPLLEGDSWKEKDFNWIKTTYDFHNFGYDTPSLFDFNALGSDDDSTENILSIDQPFLALDAASLAKGVNDKVVKAFYDYMVDIAVVFKINKSRAEKECKDVLDFMIKLGSLTHGLPTKAMEKLPSKKMTVKELRQKYPIVPWKEYFNTFMKPNPVIGDDVVITVTHPDFFDKFNNLMKKPPPKRVLANYMFLDVIQKATPYLNKELMTPYQKYASIGQGSSAAKVAPRSKLCFETTTNALTIGTGAIYLRKNFNQKSKKSVEEFAVALEEQFKKTVKEVDWMDEKTKTSALDKLKSMKNSIGSIDQFFDDKLIDEYFKTLEIPPNNYLQAYLNMKIFNSNKFFGQFRKPYKKSIWAMIMEASTFDTNVEYDRALNSIVIGAGILQDFFFNENRPQYLNYGAFGAFNFANKITRAIDNDGGQYDKDGYPKGWWTPETKKRYLQKSACINQQYASYTSKDGGQKINMPKTLEKNIADNGGVKMAYLAYQDWVKQHGPEPTLPGLEYSPSQLFWIQAAVTQCAKYSPEFLKDAENNGIMQYTGDFNSPSDFRVTGLFANRPEFATDFHCKPGSKMNPVKKCSEW